MLSCYSGNAIGGSNPSLSAFLVRSSNGKDNWFSSSQQEFDSPTNLIWKRVITGSRPDLKSGVPQGIERYAASRRLRNWKLLSSALARTRHRVAPFPLFGELAQWLVQRTVNPPIQVRFLYSPYFVCV